MTFDVTKLVALDCETFLIEPNEFAPQLVCSSVHSAKATRLYDHLDSVKVARKLLEGGYFFAFTNPGFDIATLCKQDPSLFPLFFEALDEDRIFCVSVTQKLLDIEHGSYGWYVDEFGKNKKRFYSLAALAKRHLNAQLDKDTWRLRYHELFEVPLSEWPKGAKHYALSDAKVTFEVFDHQRLLVDLTQAAERTRFDVLLYWMSREGMGVKPEYVDEYAQRIEAGLAELEPEMIRSGFVKVANKDVGQINLFTGEAVQPVYKKNTAAVGERFKKLGKDLYTEKGTIRTDYVAARDSGDELLQQWAEYVKLSTTLNKDVAFLRQGVVDGRVHTRFNSLLVNGRSSSRGPNLQNLGTDGGTRGCFVPPEGWVFLDADYSTADLHSLAQSCLNLFGRSKLAEALNQGLDPHRLFAAENLMKDTTYEDAPNHPRYKELRSIAKRGNFSFGTGIGNEGMVEMLHGFGVELPPDLPVSKLRSAWFKQWPEVKDLFEYVQSILPNVQLSGSSKRRLHTRSFTEGVSQFLQAVTADGAARAGWLIFRACYYDKQDILYGSRPVMMVHDQYLLETPAENAETKLERLCELMQEGFNFATPDVPTPAEGEIKLRWSK